MSYDRRFRNVQTFYKRLLKEKRINIIYRFVLVVHCKFDFFLFSFYFDEIEKEKFRVKRTKRIIIYVLSK